MTQLMDTPYLAQPALEPADSPLLNMQFSLLAHLTQFRPLDIIVILKFGRLVAVAVAVAELHQLALAHFLVEVAELEELLIKLGRQRLENLYLSQLAAAELVAMEELAAAED